LEQLQIEVASLAARLGRRLVLIPESDLNNPRLIRPRAHDGYQLNAQWSDDFHHALHAVLTGESNGYYEDFGTLADLAKALRDAYVYDGRYSLHRKRRHGRPAEGLDGHHFLGYAQTHDQVGNRAQGERLSQLVSVEKLKIVAALVFTSPFVPMLFQGEEWGASTPFQYFSNHAEPELANAVREGRRKEFAAFGWKPEEVPDPQARETFERSKLNWAELNREPHATLLDWHRRLIQLRRDEAALTDGRRDVVETRFDETARWLAIERGPITVLVNFADAPQGVPVRAGSHRVLLSSAELLKVAGGVAHLPGAGVAVLMQSESAV
ncbi:MAG TPA: DUF3459 domain-containing protein, partial [Verrucomicrobiae bacterium]|nr:DUF3459 domain-containing protein [Verrucomicrobiae bacterium]